MSASDQFETDLLNLILNNVAIANIGDATGLRGSSTAGSLYAAFHTADPGEAGSAQTTSEATYTGYARVAISRAGTAWSVTSGVASLVASVAFPTSASATQRMLYYTLGTAASGAGQILLRGTLTDQATPANPWIDVYNGTTPFLGAGTTISVN
jgi:hypothetical protein